MRGRCGQLGSLLCSPNARPQKVLAWVNGTSRRAGGDGVEKVVRNHIRDSLCGMRNNYGRYCGEKMDQSVSLAGDGLFVRGWPL